MFVSIVAMNIQIGMTLDVIREEVGGPGEFEMAMNVSKIKSHIKCYKYGEFGHYSNECPKYEKQETNLLEEEPTFF